MGMTKGLCVTRDEGKNYCVTREEQLKDIHDSSIYEKKPLWITPPPPTPCYPVTSRCQSTVKAETADKQPECAFSTTDSVKVRLILAENVTLLFCVCQQYLLVL